MSEPSFIEGVDVETLLTFEEEGYSDQDALDLAQGLLEDAVPCLSKIYADLPSADKKMAKYGVLEMAKYIKLDYLNFEAATSPFQSETLGSYTYNKMARSVLAQTATGVPGFDRAVTRLGALCNVDAEGGSYSTSEQVFAPGYTNYIENREYADQQGFPLSRYRWEARP